MEEQREKKADDKMRKRLRKKENQKTTRGKEKVVRKRRPQETAPGHSLKIEARGRNIDHQLWSASLILHYMHLITYTLY